VKTASEVTYTVSGGALNSAQSNPIFLNYLFGVATTITSVWLVPWQLCITRRSRRLFGTRRLLEHGPRNSGVY